MPKHRFPADPHAGREAEKYASPIPSREFILAALAEHSKPMTFPAIAEALSVKGEEDLDALRRRLRAM